MEATKLYQIPVLISALHSLLKRKVKKKKKMNHGNHCVLSTQEDASIKIHGTQIICFSCLGNTMDFRSPLAKLQFENLFKCLTHWQEHTEYIMLPDLPLIISSHLVSLSFCFTLFKKSKNSCHKEACRVDNVFAVYFETFENRICFSY